MSKPIDRTKKVDDTTVQEPGSSSEVIRQKKLEHLYDLAQRMRQAKADYDDYYKEIQHTLMEGATVQEGAYRVKYGLTYRRHPAYREYLIQLAGKGDRAKGEMYQQQCLQRTEPRAFFRVKITPPKK